MHSYKEREVEREIERENERDREKCALGMGSLTVFKCSILGL